MSDETIIKPEELDNWKPDRRQQVECSLDCAEGEEDDDCCACCW